MKITRLLTATGAPIADQIIWRTVEVGIDDVSSGRAVLSRRLVEVPLSWSDNAALILAKNYLRKAGIPDKTWPCALSNVPDWLIPRGPASDCIFGGETSARQVFHRMCGCWTYWGWISGYFCEDEVSAHVFYDELYWALANQMWAPNSPQWFSTGLFWAYGISGPDSGQWYADPKTGEPLRNYNSYERSQPHACFLTPIDDDLVNPGGIMDTWVREARIFKHGSGSGTNVSRLRGRGESLSGGGAASGVMSWLRIGDSAAGAIASGGTTRRAAVMRILDVDHPEIEAFVDWKVREEAKAASMYLGSALIDRAYKTDTWHSERDLVPNQVIERAGKFAPEVFGIGWEQEANRTVDGQNSNNSVRVTDAFMRAVRDNKGWHLTARTTGKVVKTVKARDLWDSICKAAWACADPGIQFHDTINAWNTCAADGEIRTTNPCFTGDTKVWTIFGPRRFDELAESGATVPVLTELPDGNLAYRPMVHPRLTRRNAEVVEITFKARRGIRGSKISLTTLRVTPDHEFYLKDGGSRRAIDLRPGDRIESAYRTQANQSGYVAVRATNGDNVMEHHLTAEYDYGRRPAWPQEHGHHADGIKDRNVPGNIEILDASVHNSEHMLGNNNPMRKWFRSLSAEEQAAHSAKYSRPGELNPNYGNEGHLTERVWINDGEKCRRIRANDPMPEGWAFGYLRRNNYQSEETRSKRSESVRASWERRRADANHVVVNVVPIAGHSDVYCGTVSATGRFFVSLGDDHYEGVLVSNCAEFHHLDGSACNLASLRLTAFMREGDEFDTNMFEHLAHLVTIVLDISVEMASFPSYEFAVGAWRYRTLGLGYADLGGLLMKLALPYDSDEGRALAAAITALMTGIAYRTSAELAAELGPFPRWQENAVSFGKVVDRHAEAVRHVRCVGAAGKIVVEALRVWQDVKSEDNFRNAQVTLLAPTGTISFVMDCATTGIEPDFALVKDKYLAGGGRMRIVNQAVPAALQKLGYPESRIQDIVARVNGGDSLFLMDPIHVNVFRCANDSSGIPALSPSAHVNMLAVTAPFLSGAASKTVNLPQSATVEDVSSIYLDCHRLGIKTVAIYRDGSKLAQPLSVAGKSTSLGAPWPGEPKPVRMHDMDDANKLARGTHEYLPWRREGGYTQKAKIGGQTLFWRVSTYSDGRIGEIFIELAHEGSTLRAMANCVAIAMSVALQHGTPLTALVDKYVGTKFEPAGFVEGHDRVRLASSIADLVARDLAITFLGREDLANTVRMVSVDDSSAVVALDRRALALADPNAVLSGAVCRDCGSLLVRTGTCQTCTNCGWNEGCGG